MKRDYIEECIDSVLESEGFVLCKTVKVLGIPFLKRISIEESLKATNDIAYGIDMYSEYSGAMYIPNPLQTELKETKRKHEKEMSEYEKRMDRIIKDLHEEIRSLRIQLSRALEDK